MKDIPTSFLPQLLARLSEAQPKFYQIIIKNSLILSAIAFAVPYITTQFLPGIGVEIPVWLTFLNGEFIRWRNIAMGAGLGGAFVAKTTLMTAGTPPLETSETRNEPVSMDVLLDLQRQIDELKKSQSPSPML